ncbi:unnamed protein product [Clonostachys byssicola]|uniref:Uncharacterized protein n=1 Tax=Clonostachys byssicola TaxID=160290 RepID=A0A9N9TZS3_9HYPO|nr:unnamed protein product [Clonostachys byssicola]
MLARRAEYRVLGRRDSHLFQVGVLDRTRLRRRLDQEPALAALPLCIITLEVLNGLLDLRPQVGAVERGLVDDLAAVRAVPAQAVEGPLGPALLQDDADGVGEADGVVGGVAREEEHVALPDDDIPELAVVDDLEHHGPLVLIEPLGGLVDVVICTGVGSADDLGSKVSDRSSPFITWARPEIAVGKSEWERERWAQTITVKSSL